MPNTVRAAATGLPAVLPADPSRRTFLHGLRQLAALPLIGGGVAIIGSPTRAAVPVTDQLLLTYSTWLEIERRVLHHEMDPRGARRLNNFVDMGNSAAFWHYPDFETSEARDRMRPSTRAALVLNAVGVNLREGDL